VGRLRSTQDEILGALGPHAKARRIAETQPRYATPLAAATYPIKSTRKALDSSETSADQATLFNSGLVRCVDLMDSYMAPGGLGHPSDTAPQGPGLGFAPDPGVIRTYLRARTEAWQLSNFRSKFDAQIWIGYGGSLKQLDDGVGNTLVSVCRRYLAGPTCESGG
jgi:hypothetical protein